MRFLFWAGVLQICYAYLGYPAWLWLRGRLRPKPVHRAAIFPTVSVAMVVRNEEQVLPGKLANLAGLRYPRDRIEFIIVSDGSSDRTVPLLQQRSRDDERFHVLASTEPRGKACGLNDCMARAQGEVVLFTDARQELEPQALQLLLENFADPSVGCVSGELMLGSPAQGEANRGTGLYWTIEKKIRQWESASGSAVGATGAIYAVRRALLSPIPPGTILDDVYSPMQVIRRGFRVVFDERAHAWDVPNLGEKREFGRKVRTLTGNYQLLQLAPWLLGNRNPIRFEFVSHKLMRLLVPFSLIATLLSSVLLNTAFFRSVLILQLLFYFLGLLGMAGAVNHGRLGRLTDAARTFLMLNAAAAVAFANWVTGRQAVWTPPGREVAAVMKASQSR